MIVESWVINYPPRGWFRLKVHDTLESLQAYCRSRGESDSHEILATFWQIQRPKSTYLGGLHVSMQTAREHVIHECLHVASCSWRRVHPRLDLGDTITHQGSYDEDPEEQFAFLLGGYTEPVLAIMDTLHAEKGWPVAE